MEKTDPRPAFLAAHSTFLKVILVLVTGLVFGGWLYLTPPGLLGKADAVGYAVCHRIADRSFAIGDRQAPLCSRCSGMFLGGLLGIAYLGRFGRRAGMPSLSVSIVLGLFLLAFAIDGGNSYLTFFPYVTGLYGPENWLRLFTGSGVGLGIAAILVPVFHQTLWKTYDPRPALSGWRAFLPLIGLVVLLNLAVLSEIPVLLYPLAVFSSMGTYIILTMVYTVVWILIARRDNRFEHYRELWPALVAGFLTATVQIAVLDAGRYWLTGTWAGFNL